MCEARIFFNTWNGRDLARDEHEACSERSTHQVFDASERRYSLCAYHALQVLREGHAEVTDDAGDLVELSDLEAAE